MRLIHMIPLKIFHQICKYAHNHIFLHHYFYFSSKIQNFYTKICPIFTPLMFFHPRRFLIFGVFPPNTVIPYHMFIFLEADVHPMRLFHTLRLLDSLEYPLTKSDVNVIFLGRLFLVFWELHSQLHYLVIVVINR